MPRPENSDSDGSVEIDGFSGLNNRDPIQRSGLKSLRAAINVDLDADGHVTRRPGFAQAYSGAALHSLWGGDDYLLCVEGSALKRLTENPDGTLSAASIGSGFVPNRPVCYEQINGDVYLSNGQATGKVVAGSLLPWGVQTPGRQPTLAADAVGGLHAGTYQVAVTFVSNSGEESGSQAPQPVEVAEGGGILLSGLPQATEANVTRLRIYVSPPNEDVLYLASELAAGSNTAYIHKWDTGYPLKTAFLDKFPPCVSIARIGGRVVGVSGNVLYWSDSLRFGLYHTARNWMPFPANCRLVAAVENIGLYVVTEDRTYFLAGVDPEQWALTEVLAYGAPAQQVLQVPREAFNMDIPVSRVPVWLSTRGFHAGLPGGIVNLTEKQVVVDSYERITALYREQSGIKQVIAVGANGRTPRFAVGDSVAAEIRRNGVTV